MWLASVLALKECSKDESSGISSNGDLSNIMWTIIKLLMVADEDDAVNQWYKHYCTCSNQTGYAYITCT